MSTTPATIAATNASAHIDTSMCARIADKMSKTRRSDSRHGIDMDAKSAERALAVIKSGLSRGMSPYEISVAYERELGVHCTTIYRWVQEGYGGLTNLELERKVGFIKPRKNI